MQRGDAWQVFYHGRFSDASMMDENQVEGNKNRMKLNRELLLDVGLRKSNKHET